MLFPESGKFINRFAEIHIFFIIPAYIDDKQIQREVWMMDFNENEMEREPENEAVSSNETAEVSDHMSQAGSEPSDRETEACENRKDPAGKSPWDPYYTGRNDRGFREQAPAHPVPKKKTGVGKRIAAVAAALLIVAGCCGVTAAAMNGYWEKESAKMSADFRQQLAALESKMSELETKAALGSGVSVSGTASADGLTPAQVYAQNVRSVVAISANQTTTNVYGQVSEKASSGSGFFLTSDGYVVTNHHVIEGASNLTVITHDGTEYPAVLVGSNATNDVALLKVEGENFPAVTIGSSDDLIVGDMVVAIGNPLGELTSTQTVGYVSAKDRTINIDGTYIDMLQTDAAINAGNSGGPLFNMKGEVVGITSAKYSGSTFGGATIEGIGFAIPIDDVIGMISDLQQYGYITGAYLGVMVRSMDTETAAMYNLPVGVYVESVTEGSCAETAGLKSKDIIIGMGEDEISGYTDLARALRKYKAGDTTTIRVYRGGTELTLTVTLDEKPHEDTTAQQTPAPDDSGVPENGSYDEWYRYFERIFGKGEDDE